MMTLRQMADRILSDESMTINSNPWTRPVAYSGTAPSDLEYMKRERLYRAIEIADMEMRKWFHTHSKKTLMEKVQFTVGPTERTIPVTGMRYIELVIDSDGREVVVEGYGAQSRLTMAGYKNIYLPYPVSVAPYRLVITRPGYMLLSPTTETKTLTVYYIRDRSFYDRFLGEFDDVQPWSEYVAAGVTHSVDASDYAEMLPVLYNGASYGGSLKFVCPAGFPGHGNLIATTNETSFYCRAGQSISGWMKMPTPLDDVISLVFGKTAACAVIGEQFALMPISNDWQKFNYVLTSSFECVSIGLKIYTASERTFRIDSIRYSEFIDNDIPLIAPDEYLNLILPLAARKQLNQDIGREIWQTQEVELEKRLQSFKSSDGSGERTRRLIVKVP